MDGMDGMEMDQARQDPGLLKEREQQVVGAASACQGPQCGPADVPEGDHRR